MIDNGHRSMMSVVSIATLLITLTLARADFSCPAYTFPPSYYHQPDLNCTLATDLEARCLTLEVPLDHAAPVRGNISLFVKSVRARQQPARGGTALRCWHSFICLEVVRCHRDLVDQWGTWRERCGRGVPGCLADGTNGRAVQHCNSRP